MRCNDVAVIRISAVAEWYRVCVCVKMLRSDNSRRGVAAVAVMTVN